MAAETIYTGFSSTKALLRAAMDVAIVGDAQPVPLIEREEFQQLDSVLAAIMLFGMPLPAPDAGRYVSEMTLAAELPLKLRRKDQPITHGDGSCGIL